MNILDPQGPIAAADKQILINSIAIMLAIVLPTIAAIFAFAWYFRASNTRAFHWPDWEYSGRLELVVWSIPALTIILLGGVAWIGSHQLDPAKPVAGTGQGVTIEVVSLDWKWLFIYPDQRIASVNTLTVPVGAPLHFQLTSASVMNVFFIPQLGSMIYTMNGMVTRLELRADQVGNYQGLSAHFSGDGFPDMLFDVHVVSAAGLCELRLRYGQERSRSEWRQLQTGAAQAIGAEGQDGLSARRSRTVHGDRDPEDSAGSRSAGSRQHRSRQCSVS